MAPNQRHPSKKPLKVYLTRLQHFKFSKFAASERVSMSELIMQYVERATKHIELTQAEKKLIEEETNRRNRY